MFEINPKLNSMPFQHRSHNGTEFHCARCDFRGETIEITDRAKKEEWFLTDLSEMIAYHCLNILPQLNGFAGYDCIRFKNKKS